MYKKITFIITVLLTFKAIDSKAQSKHGGRIETETHKGISGATVKLLNGSRKLLNQTSTDSTGAFSFDQRIVGRFIEVSNVGFIPFLGKIENEVIVITLFPNIQQLAEVMVKGDKPFIERNFNGITLNVNGDSKAGINVVDVLKKAPGIIINNDQSISLEGKDVTVYIDGRPTIVKGKDLMNYLNGLSSANVNQIVINYTPSSKMDADAPGGIIDIKTLRRTSDGANGNINLTAGQGWKYPFGNGTGTLLLKHKSLNMTATYNAAGGQQYQEININRSYPDASKGNELQTIKTPNFNQFLRIGLDFSGGKRNTFGAVITANDNHTKTKYSSISTLINQGNLNNDSLSDFSNLSKIHSWGGNINLNFRHNLDSVGSAFFTMDLDGGRFLYNANDNITNENFTINKNALLSRQFIRQDNESTTNIFSLKVDYTKKVKNGRFEAGVKGSNTDIDNFYFNDYYLQANDFIYKEQIIAAYFNLFKTYNKTSIQLGIRGEKTITKGQSLSTNLDSTFTRNYFNLFPNITIEQQFKNSRLTASYSRRIGRPYYNYLNPFVIVRSPYEVATGNPYLRPSLTDSYRLNYSVGKFTATAGYTYAKNTITDLQFQNDETKVINFVRANFTSNRSRYFNLSYNTIVFKKLQLNYSTSVGHNTYKFNYGILPVEVSQVSGTLAMDNLYSISKDLWIDLYAYGRTKITYGSNINLPSGFVDIGAGKNIFKGKGSITFMVNDIFFSNITRTETKYINIDNTLRSQYDSRKFRISVVYKIGSKNLSSNRHYSGSEDEQRRKQ
jgi:hypothetical protein